MNDRAAESDAARVVVPGRPLSSPATEQRFDAMNLAVLAVQTAAWAGSLSLLGRIESWPWRIALLLVFCLMMQGVFSMMHECFHRHGHRNPRVNTLMMWWASTLFGASATLIRINHLGHHVRNRTPAERVDFADADESLVAKRVAYYFAIFGGIWIASFLGSLLLSLLPARVTARLSAGAQRNTYAAAFADFTARDFRNIRIEVAAGIAVWAVLIGWLGWQWQDLLLAYTGFAFTWSSLQWIYHVRTPLDVVEGAFNMRAPWPIRALFLNFNYNLSHHRQPATRWQALHRISDLKETRPLWFGWLQIFLPPQRMPDPATLAKTYF